MEKKTAIVTGSAQGIGKAIATELADQGYNVIVNDIDEEQASNTVTEIIEDDGEASKVIADVSTTEGREKIFNKTLEEYGSIELLVNNAGVQTNTPFLELTEDEWDTVIGINLKGAYFLSQKVANHMVDKGIEGDIINISSVHEDTPTRNRNHYSASKAGMKMMTKEIALELSDHTINVNSIAPGFIKTPKNTEVMEDEEETKKWYDKIPAGRFAEAHEVAEVVKFLASEEAAYITGESITIDGGLQHSTMEGLI